MIPVVRVGLVEGVSLTGRERELRVDAGAAGNLVCPKQSSVQVSESAAVE